MTCLKEYNEMTLKLIESNKVGADVSLSLDGSLCLPLLRVSLSSLAASLSSMLPLMSVSICLFSYMLVVCVYVLWLCVLTVCFPGS
jgi:hypothetical protein